MSQKTEVHRLALFNMRQPDRTYDLNTTTMLEQIKTENVVRKAYYEKLGQWKKNAFRLFKLNHVRYLNENLSNLPRDFEHLDASQPWLAYWMVHGLRLLNFTISDDTKKGLIQLIRSVQNPDGGFGGGPYQFSHLAASYGAVNCLALLCQQDALEVINRETLLGWYRKIKQTDGSFTVHFGGENDVRGAYCAVAIASLTGLLDKHPDLFEGTAEWIASCQTYEGGFGCLPGIEAHGGYTFCAVSALYLLGKIDLIDIPRLLRWASNRQMAAEGGFQGRTNKLVDSCYSFWQGALFPIIEQVLWKQNDVALPLDDTLFDATALQEYILLCCQKVSYTRHGMSVHTKLDDDLEDLNTESTLLPDFDEQLIAHGGGLIDKPGKNTDPYHTCYSLSGLSVAQHVPRLRIHDPTTPYYYSSIPAESVDVLGESLNELNDIDPFHNVLHEALIFSRTYFLHLDSHGNKKDAVKDAALIVEKYGQSRTILKYKQSNIRNMYDNCCSIEEISSNHFDSPQSDTIPAECKSTNNFPFYSCTTP